MSHVKTGIKPHYFTALDGFRGVLAVMIALYHTMWMSHVNSTALFTNGPILVDMFFVFSGFLMFTLYDGHLNDSGAAKSFIKKRFARIYPLHFFMLLVALLYAVARVLAHYFGFAHTEAGEILPFQSGANETLWSFLSNLTLTQSMGLHDDLSYNMPSWTVSVEFWTYFVFIGMMLWARPKKPWHFGLLGLLVAANYYWLSTIKPDMNFHYDYGFWRCLGGFFTGVITAFVYRSVRPKFDTLKTKIKSNLFFVGASVAEIAALAIMTGFVVYCPGKAQFFIAPIAFIFVFGFAFDMGLISRFLKLNIFRYIAKISYSIYMVHVVISLFFAIFIETFMPQIFGAGWNDTQMLGTVMLIPYLTCVIVCSHFIYKYIELPGRKAIVTYEFGSKWRQIFSKLQTRKA